MRKQRNSFAATLLALLMLLGAGPFGGVAAQGSPEDNAIFGYARNGDSAAVDYMIRKGISVEFASPAGETVLIIAAANGQLETVEIALGHGARVNRADDVGHTALTRAAERGHVPVTERLLAAGANIDHQTGEGLTPVMLAVRSNQLSMLQHLLAQKPDLSLLDYTGRSALDWARDGRDRRAEAMLKRAGAS